MTAQDSYQTLKAFFESRQAAQQAMRAIKEGVEIGIVIGDTIECALYRRGNDAIVENRAARSPDVIFHIQPESVEILSSRTKDDIGDIGVNVLKEVLAGNIRIRVPGKLIHLMTRGYMDMLKQGGAPVLAFLSKHGLASLSKISAVIGRLKSDRGD